MTPTKNKSQLLVKLKVMSSLFYVCKLYMHTREDSSFTRSLICHVNPHFSGSIRMPSFLDLLDSKPIICFS